MTVWQFPVVAIPPQTARVLLIGLSLLSVWFFIGATP